MKITFPDGSSKNVDKGTTGQQVAELIGPGLAKAAVGILLDGEPYDLSRPIEKDASVQILTLKDKEGLDIVRHSTAHVLAQAVLELFPGTKLTIGPIIEDGFYYDFDVKESFKPEDLEKIKTRMREIIKNDLKVERKELSKEDAKKEFKDNEYKIELVEENEDPSLTVYSQGEFFDLCRGPHVPNTKKIPVDSFALIKISASYWRGDATKASLQRIYGVQFEDKKKLNAYLQALEEAQKYDHKKLGREMNLFMISDLIGKGLPVWLPHGEIFKREIENFAVEKEKKHGYIRVATPHLAKKELFLTSGHLPHYEDGMYPKMTMDDGDYYLKAMNCPMHHLVYKHHIRSYKDLPLRIAEYGTVYRNELSGTLSGLLRVRMLSMNDAHIYCRKDQIADEIKAVMRLTLEFYKDFGLKDYYFRLSLWSPDNKEKYIDEPDNWEYAEDALRSILKELNVEFVEESDEAAFYGPKIDIQFRTVTGREETMSTIQLDFAAKKRFELAYIDQDGKENNEVFVIHRSPLSTHERFAAFLIEHYKGNFPIWLCPVQAIILPIADRHVDKAKEYAAQLSEQNVRVEIDDSNNTLSKKVRNAELRRIPYIFVVGDKEAESNAVNVRTRDNEVKGEKAITDMVKQLVQEIKQRQLQSGD